MYEEIECAPDHPLGDISYLLLNPIVFSRFFFTSSLVTDGCRLCQYRLFSLGFVGAGFTKRSVRCFTQSLRPPDLS